MSRKQESNVINCQSGIMIHRQRCGMFSIVFLKIDVTLANTEMFIAASLPVMWPLLMTTICLRQYVVAAGCRLSSMTYCMWDKAVHDHSRPLHYTLSFPLELKLKLTLINNAPMISHSEDLNSRSSYECLLSSFLHVSLLGSFKPECTHVNLLHPAQSPH